MYGILSENGISRVITGNVAVATLREVVKTTADQPFQTVPDKVTFTSSDIPNNSANHAKSLFFRINKLKRLQGLKRIGLKMMMFSLLPDISRKMSPDHIHTALKKVLS